MIRRSMGFKTAATLRLCGLLIGPMLSAATFAGEAPKVLSTLRVVDGNDARSSDTGTKTDTPVLEIPQAVSVITRAELDTRGASTLREALGYTAGVQVEQSVDLRDEWFRLRGFGGTQNVFRDGLRIGLSSGYANADLNLYGLERIEVLRGPSSVLYGQTGPGGVVNLVTKRPTNTPLHEIELLAGSFNRKQAAADFSGPLSDKFGYRLTGLVVNSDTQTDFVKNDRTYIAPALAWQPSTNTSLTVLAHYQQDSQGAVVNNSLPRIGTLSPNINGQIPLERYPGEPSFDKFEKSQWAMGYLFSHRLSETWAFKQNLRYSHIESDYASAYTDELAADQRTAGRSAYTPSDSANALTLDNQVQATWATAKSEHTVLFGIDYRRTNYALQAGFDDAPAIDIFNPVYGVPVVMPTLYEDSVTRASQAGVYLQEQAKLDKQWVFLLGGRWDRVKTEKSDSISNSRSAQSDSKFTGRVGAVYLADNGLAPYVSYSTSFEPVIGESALGETFNPATGKQTELGLRYQPGDRGMFAVAVFDLTQQNVLTTDPDDPNFRTQTGEIRARGIELEAKFVVTEALNLDASYTHLDVKIIESNDGVGGNRRGGVPRDVAALWADYTIHSGALQGLSAGAGARFTTKTVVADTNIYSMPARTLIDAMLRYDWNQFTAVVNASNLFNKEYVGFCANDDYGFCGYGPARNIGVSLRYLR